MTTSKALHNHLVALSQKGRKRNQPSKYQRISAGRVVELTKVVLSSAKGTAHHLTSRVAGEAKTSEQGPSDKKKAASARDTYYPKLQEELAQELQQLKDKRDQVRQDQVELWGLYKYALEKVSNLSDLRDAPDAILPGNFPGEPKIEAVVAAKKEAAIDESKEARV